jgi:hypothetical protein
MTRPGDDMTRPARLAWSLFAATIALLGVQTYFVLASHTPLKSDELGLNSFPIITLGTALGALLGALVASRHPGNRVGWLFCVGQLGTAVGLAADAFGTAAQFHGQPAADWMREPAVILSYSLGAVWALTVVSAIFLIVPDGRLPSRWWRPVAWALPVPVVVSSGALAAFASTHHLAANQDQSNVAWYYVFTLAASWVLLALTLAATTTSLVLRLRRSQGVLRQQLRWIAAAATALLIGTVIAISSPAAGDQPWTWVLNVPLYVGYASVPVAAGVAVLKYRLYDIDVVISRAALLALLLVFVTCGYVVAVVSIGRLLGDRVGDSFTLSLLATMVVALAFQPVRSGAVRFADHIAYGRRAAPYEALADLSRRLGESPDPATLLPAVTEAAATAVGAQQATVRLCVPGGPDRVASWPAAGLDVVWPEHERAVTQGGEDDETVVPVADRGERLGSITVALPPGRALRGHEQRLLTDLADQTALAFRNARLTAELATRVAELDASTIALARSRQRLIDARDAERARLESAIRREVIRHLQHLPHDLQQLGVRATGGEGCTATQLQPLVDSTAAALEELREITRGIFPAQLVRAGLAPAIATHLGRVGSADALVVDESAAGRRFEARAEAAAYFCYVEAVRGLGPPREVALAVQEEMLLVRVRGADQGRDGLAPMRDRLETLGGTVVRTSTGGQVELLARLPAARSSAQPAARSSAQSSADA